jgi:Zn-dependent protease
MIFLNLDLYTMVLTIPAILVAFTFHEYAHALVADRLGDKTPKFQGRLTLNPFAHIDPVGFIMILLFHFGWAKPVEINPNAFKNGYKDDLKVSIAGPVANLIMALIFGIAAGFFARYYIYFPIPASIIRVLFDIISLIVQINCMLFVFNIIPLPGLDGFHVLRDLFPKAFNNISDFVYRYQMFILLIFIATPISTFLVGIPASFLTTFFMNIIK